MLSIPSQYREKKEPLIYIKIIELNWKKLLDYPFNTSSKFTAFEKLVKYYLNALKYNIKLVLSYLK